MSSSNKPRNVRDGKCPICGEDDVLVFINGKWICEDCYDEGR